VQAVLASLSQILSFDVVTLPARLRQLSDDNDKTMLIFATLVADAVRVALAAWIVVVVL
jgi:hypothetical protein